MPKAPLPAITGKQLIRLLRKAGWSEARPAKHGITLTKHIPECRTLVTLVAKKGKSLPPGTLADILGDGQTRLGKKGLRELIEEHGL
jgi:predicted RNA binding protein YcfA (HicA-like mRNA interferase family)